MSGIDEIGRLREIVSNTGDILTDTGTTLPADHADIQTVVDENSFNCCATVHIDTVNGAAGTAYPIGSALHPVDNLADALTIATARGIEHLHIHGTLGNLAGAVAGLFFEGDVSPTIGAPFINLNNISTVNSTFRHCLVTGQCNGLTQFEGRSILVTTTGLQGSFNDCEFLGVHALANVGSDINNCSSLFGYATFNCTALAGATHVRVTNWSGGVHVTNLTGGTISLAVNDGTVTIEASCTGGTVIVNGNPAVVDNNGGSTVTRNDISGRAKGLDATFDALEKKREWGTKVNGSASPTDNAGTTSTPVNLTITAPSEIAVHLSFQPADIPASDVMYVELQIKADETNWETVGYAEMSGGFKFFQSSNGANGQLSPGTGGNTIGSAWMGKYYVDSGTDFRIRLSQVGGTDAVGTARWHYNILSEA